MQLLFSFNLRSKAGFTFIFQVHSAFQFSTLLSLLNSSMAVVLLRLCLVLALAAVVAAKDTRHEGQKAHKDAHAHVHAHAHAHAHAHRGHAHHDSAATAQTGHRHAHQVTTATAAPATTTAKPAAAKIAESSVEDTNLFVRDINPELIEAERAILEDACDARDRQAVADVSAARDALEKARLDASMHETNLTNVRNTRIKEVIAEQSGPAAAAGGAKAPSAATGAAAAAAATGGAAGLRFAELDQSIEEALTARRSAL